MTDTSDAGSGGRRPPAKGAGRAPRKATKKVTGAPEPAPRTTKRAPAAKAAAPRKATGKKAAAPERVTPAPPARSRPPSKKATAARKAAVKKAPVSETPRAAPPRKRAPAKAAPAVDVTDPAVSAEDPWRVDDFETGGGEADDFETGDVQTSDVEPDVPPPPPPPADEPPASAAAPPPPDAPAAAAAPSQGGNWAPPPPPPQGGWPPPAGGQWAGSAPPKTEGTAVGGFIAALVSVPLFMLLIPSIVAIVLGGVARGRIKRDPSKKGKGLATAALVIGILTLLGGIATDAGIAYFATQMTTYEALEVGDCVKEPGDSFGLLRNQSCSGKHEQEVFAVFNSPQPSSAQYPGSESLRLYAQTECAGRLSATSTNVPVSELSPTVLIPSERRWEDGQRRIVCLVGRQDGQPLDGPLQGTG